MEITSSTVEWDVKVFIDVVKFCTFSTDHTNRFVGEVSICA